MSQTQKTNTPTATDSNVKKAFTEEVKGLCVLRDELKLQAHLFKAEAKDRFFQLENRFRDLEDKMKVIEVESTKVIASEIRDFAKELKEEYASFKKGKA